MEFKPGLHQGESIDNLKLCEIFKCSSQGGMRKSNKNSTLVLISNRVKSIYEDRWEGKTLYYTGMGQTGDQSLMNYQNKTLLESNKNGVRVFLFEVFKEKQYIYQGEVKLVEKPYQEKQLDSNNELRNVWIFPIQLIDYNSPAAISEELLIQKQITKEKQIASLSDEELKQKATMVDKKCSSRETKTNQFERNPYVVEYVKRKAKGVCQLCSEKAPFNNKNGSPYLEVHHIIWLSQGGDDSIENAAALCPNCHKKMHILNLKRDIEVLVAKNS